MVCALLFPKVEWKRDSQKSLPAVTEAGWELPPAHLGSQTPPQHAPPVPGSQYLHGAQGHQLHKGVCSDLLDLVVLETPGKQKLI